MENEEIKAIVDRLIETFHPRMVFLFGSHAWGTPGKGSDIDILVLLDDSDLSQPDRIRLGLRSLRGISTPVDILVFTTSEIAERKNHPSTLIYKVLHKGVKLYEAA